MFQLHALYFGNCHRVQLVTMFGLTHVGMANIGEKRAMSALASRIQLAGITAFDVIVLAAQPIHHDRLIDFHRACAVDLPDAAPASRFLVVVAQGTLMQAAVRVDDKAVDKVAAAKRGGNVKPQAFRRVEATFSSRTSPLHLVLFDLLY